MFLKIIKIHWKIGFEILPWPHRPEWCPRVVTEIGPVAEVGTATTVHETKAPRHVADRDTDPGKAATRQVTSREHYC